MMEEELEMMAKEKANLCAELEAQRLEKLHMETHLQVRSQRYLDSSTSPEGKGESTEYLRLKREIDILKGEVRAGYKFVTALPSTTSRSSNSGGESGGVSAPCSSRTGNTCTPRTGRALGTPRIPRSGSISGGVKSPPMEESPLDPPEAPPLDRPEAAPADFVVWGF
jgi:hypothetical protein